MGAAVTAEPKSKSKTEVSAAQAEPAPSAFDLEAAYGAPAGMPLFLAGGLQRKLAVGAVDDPLEREADQVAEQVMRSIAGGTGFNTASQMTNDSRSEAGLFATPPSLGNHPRADLGAADSAIQRKCACGGSSSGECEECRKREEELPGAPVIQRRTNNNDGHSAAATDAPPIVHQALRSPGQPLDGSVRPLMESRFGRDFSSVRVHTDSLAAKSAQAINARAYTAGKNVVFGPGQYSPDSGEGKQLLAHELTHTIQQGATEAFGLGTGAAPASDSERIQRQPAEPDSGHGTPPPGPNIAMPTSSLIEKNVPAAGDDLIKFEGVLLSTSVEFVRYQLEEMIASVGLNGATTFVTDFTSSPQADQATLARSQKLREDLEQYGPGDVSGAPLASSTEDEIRHRMANQDRVLRVIPVVQREFKLLEIEAKEFLSDFESLAEQKMFEALRESQTRIEGEAKRYGFSPAQLFSGPELQTTKFPEPQTPADVIQQTRGQQADAARYAAAQKSRQELIQAAIEIRRRKAVVQRIESQLQSIKNPPSQYAFPKALTALDMMKEMKVEEDLRKAKTKFNEFLLEKQRAFPILAAFAHDDADLSKLTGPDDESFKAVLLTQINEKLANIFKTRENMQAGKIKPWDIPFVVEGTRHLMKVDKGTLRGRVLDDRYEEAKQEKREEKERWEAIGTLSLAFGLLALIPTPLSPALGAVSTALGVAVTAHDIAEYTIQSAASGTDFDKALAISQEDPSLFWLAVEIVGTALDLGMAAKSLKGISALKRAVVAGEEGAVKALESEASKFGPAAAKRLVDEAEAARRAAMAEARSGAKAAQVIEEEAIKAGKLAEETFEYGGHTYQVLKDGRVVRCSKWCSDLELLFGDLFKSNEHLAAELEKLRALKGRAAAEAAGKLGERMDLIRKAEKMSLADLEKLLDQPQFAKGASQAADDLRYVRYQKMGGELGFEDWFSRSRGGRLGGPEHQQIIDDIRKQYGAKTVTERGVENRFADAFTPAEGGKKAIYHQVGDVNLRGDPIARERRAIDDIRRAVGNDADIVFYPKDSPKTPLVNPDKDPRFAKTWSTD